ncbi:MAG: hypothetical protein JWM63_4856 [Gammaproteobacteria bacterium]|jgi:hypothetical protein|nr:hypothetical protein [Gammaproteobacteria bacterium]
MGLGQRYRALSGSKLQRDGTARAWAAVLRYHSVDHWGRPDSTWVCEPSRAYRGVGPSLITLQIIVANDDNYALAA